MAKADFEHPEFFGCNPHTPAEHFRAMRQTVEQAARHEGMPIDLEEHVRLLQSGIRDADEAALRTRGKR